MKIYGFFVMKESGFPIYMRSYNISIDSSNYLLITSFFGAIMQFSTNILKENINIMEIGDFRFVFRYIDDTIYILASSSTDSVLLISERLDRIMKSFRTHCNIDKIIENAQIYEDSKLDHEIDDIVNFVDDYSGKVITPIKSLFEKLTFSGDIVAGALLSLKGDIYYTSLPIEDLHIALREIEIRTRAETRILQTNPKFIWQAEDKMIFSHCVSISNFSQPVYIVLLFDARTNLGMADYCIENLVHQISEYDS